MPPALPEPSESNAFLVDQVRLLRDSLRRLTGLKMCPSPVTDEEAARAVYFAPLVVVSHDTAADPVFNYANRAAQELFEMTWAEFTVLPSRLSAEMPNREERARLLAEVSAKGFIGNYAGVRISKSGQRFRIENATVWNLADETGTPRGQAAMFERWRVLGPDR